MGKGNSAVRGTFKNVLSLNSSPSEMKTQKTLLTADVVAQDWVACTVPSSHLGRPDEYLARLLFDTPAIRG